MRSKWLTLFYVLAALKGPFLTVSSLSDGRVLLQWSKVPREYMPGILSEYIVQYYNNEERDKKFEISFPPMIGEHRLKGKRLRY